MTFEVRLFAHAGGAVLRHVATARASSIRCARRLAAELLHPHAVVLPSTEAIAMTSRIACAAYCDVIGPVPTASEPDARPVITERLHAPVRLVPPPLVLFDGASQGGARGLW